MTVIAFPTDGLSERDLKLVMNEGLLRNWNFEELLDDDGGVSAALISRAVCWHARRERWHITRERGRYAVHSVFGDLIADGIILAKVLELAFRPAQRASGSSRDGVA